MVTIKEFSEKLASSAPVPGGGSASALVGSLAASLLQMSANLTINKKKYAQFHDSLQDIIDQSENLRIKLLENVQQDQDSYLALNKAYSIDGENPDRGKIIEEALKKSADAPLAAMENTALVIGLLERIKPMCSKLLISDVATGAMLAYGCMYGCAINVLVNTKLMDDKDYSKKINERVDKLMDKFGSKACDIYTAIYQEMAYDE